MKKLLKHCCCDCDAIKNGLVLGLGWSCLLCGLVNNSLVFTLAGATCLILFKLNIIQRKVENGGCWY